MSRWLVFPLLVILGLLLLLCGLLVPAHLQATDVEVIQQAGRRSASLEEEASNLLREKKYGAAEMLWQHAGNRRQPGAAELQAGLARMRQADPNLAAWGLPDARVDTLLWADHRITNGVSQPLTDVVLRLENRGKLMAYLRVSPRPVLQELTRSRSLTNTVFFPPGLSASGQAYDAALAVIGLMLDAGDLPAGFRDLMGRYASQANLGGSTEPLEQVLLDVMSLGRRYNYGQLSALLARVEDSQTIRTFASIVRRGETNAPALLTLVHLSGQPASVAKYLTEHSKTGLSDLGRSLDYGAGGLKELLSQNKRLYEGKWRDWLKRAEPVKAFMSWATGYAYSLPWFTLMMKWLLFFGGGFLLAASVHFGRGEVSELERPLQVGGFHVARESLFALGFMLFVLLLSEPFLSQESQKANYNFRLRIPSVAGASNPASVKSTIKPSTLMTRLSILTLLLFFVLQSLIYTACLVKLAEIRRQNISTRMKLKLLENEDHLFDAGLYLGFVGTIISLILSSLGVIQPSLMAGYSSTSFGIIFVSVFKIFHLRPLRRKLLLLSDADDGAQPPEGRPTGLRTLGAVS
jgi:hypothetical protein